MSGTDHEKFACIIEAQEAIMDKISDMEVDAAIRGERLQSHVTSFERQTKHKHETFSQIQELIAMSKAVHANQEILLSERQASIDFWNRMKEKIASTGILGALGLLGGVLWYAFQQFLLHGPKG